MKWSLLIILALVFSIRCTSVESNKVKSNYKEKESHYPIDSIGSFSIKSLIDSGLIVNASTYKLEILVNRKFNDINIHVKICATFENNGFGNIDSLIVDLHGTKHKIEAVEYFIQSPNQLIDIRNNKNHGIKICDYNFDNEPDVAIYNSASGMKNIYEDIFIYNTYAKKFIYNLILSESSNCTIDTLNKNIYTFGQGGMASMIYNSETYKWDHDKLILIQTVRQNYSDELKTFIKETKDLIDTSWISSRDTLSEEIIFEMREGK